jgi:uncharacterized protein
LSQIIDRRLNGKNKSAVNRQRFIRRYKEQIKRAVSDAIAGRSITDLNSGEKITIPSKDISEPHFHHGQGGRRESVHPGNKEFRGGDRVKRPSGGQGSGSGAGQASKDGQGEDSFAFELSREEFMDFFFQDLELPNLVKKQLARESAFKWVRAGYTTAGVPTNINVIRSLRQSLARRIALTAPARGKLRKAEAALEDALKTKIEDHPDVRALREEILKLKRRIQHVPFIDPIDLRFNHRVKQPKPTTQAVMFCIMDVSGSMDQAKKDIAKRFFILLYLFLTRNYERIDVVFIRHHTVAAEVNEQDFFYSRETGGTVVSSALELAADIMTKRYNTTDWNIYCAQASDGDNWHDDSARCGELLVKDIMPMVQYFAYVEITAGHHQSLWAEYEKVAEQFPNFALQQIEGLQDIYPVFRQLFKKQMA